MILYFENCFCTEIVLSTAIIGFPILYLPSVVSRLAYIRSAEKIKHSKAKKNSTSIQLGAAILFSDYALDYEKCWSIWTAVSCFYFDAKNMAIF